MKSFIDVAIKEAKKAAKKGDVPVGAVIVRDNIIISKAHNEKELKQNPTRHAEIIAIEKACKKLKTWHLDECTMYVTLEPCLMCCGAIIQSRIKNVYYGLESNKFGYIESVDKLFNNLNPHKMEKVENLHNIECKEILNNFFKNKR